jgi:hypothetical protein
MEGWQLAIVLKPLGLFVLFAIAYSGARLVGKQLPEGRLKRFLFISWRT